MTDIPDPDAGVPSDEPRATPPPESAPAPAPAPSPHAELGTDADPAPDTDSDSDSDSDPEADEDFAGLVRGIDLEPFVPDRVRRAPPPGFGRLASEWAEAQRALRRRFEADPDDAGLPRTPVYWRALKLRRGFLRRDTGAPLIAVWLESDPPGTPARLTFDALPEHWTTTVSEGAAEAVGDLQLNGALVLDTGEGLLWPVYNPSVPSFRTPHR